MCGIVGFITSAKQSRHKFVRDYMRQGLIVDAVRGQHATGVFYGIKETHAVGWVRNVIPGQLFVDTKDYDHVDTQLPSCWFSVGHNRFATAGSGRVLRNAHPFSEGPITLVHNGTLTGEGGLKTSWKSLGVEVDSHAICHNLGLHTAQEVLENITGAYALVWHDERDHSLNFARNSSRTLYMHHSKSASMTFFASESLMMEWLLDRNSGPKDGKSVILPTGEIHKYVEGTLEPTIIKYDAHKSSRWDGDDYMYGGGYYGGGASRSHVPRNGTPSVHHTDHVKVNKAANVILNNHGFDHTDRLPFIPLERNGNITIGTIKGFDQPAFVINIRDWNHTQHDKRVWTVRPVGVRYHPNANPTKPDEEVVLCRVVKFDYNENEDFVYGEGWDSVTKKSEPAPQVLEQIPVRNNDVISPVPALPAPIVEPPVKKPRVKLVAANGYQPRLLDGPLGKQINIIQWGMATKHGCASCSEIPVPDEAPGLLWLPSGDGFLCADCAVAEIVDQTHIPF